MPLVEVDFTKGAGKYPSYARLLAQWDMIGTITGSVAENEDFPNTVPEPRFTTASARVAQPRSELYLTFLPLSISLTFYIVVDHPRLCYKCRRQQKHGSFLNPRYEKAQPFGVPRDRILMGSPGFALDDQAMIAHVTSPFTDKIAPYGSTHPPILLEPKPLQQHYVESLWELVLAVRIVVHNLTRLRNWLPSNIQESNSPLDYYYYVRVRGSPERSQNCLRFGRNAAERASVVPLHGWSITFARMHACITISMHKATKADGDDNDHDKRDFSVLPSCVAWPLSF
ncbi:hypothetical protein M0804_009416 [Polistes exclamans]|nr:hypothetical protein M0804_009416 [Polistes exclamans]